MQFISWFLHLIRSHETPVHTVGNTALHGVRHIYKSTLSPKAQLTMDKSARTSGRMTKRNELRTIRASYVTRSTKKLLPISWCVHFAPILTASRSMLTDSCIATRRLKRLARELGIEGTIDLEVLEVRNLRIRFCSSRVC